MNYVSKVLSGLIGFSLLFASTSQADDVSDRITAALLHPEREAEDQARDELRKPLDTVAFIGIETGMSVLDVSAGGGWYSEVLAAAVGPEGRVVAQNNPRFADRSAPALSAKIARYPQIESIVSDTEGYGLDGQMDAAWTALNLHDPANRSRESGLQFLSAIYDSLKPGGLVAVIDHEGSPEYDNAELHRIETASAVELLEAAGFVVEARSDVLDNPNDDHSLHMRDESLARNTDRFLIRARKPQ